MIVDMMCANIWHHGGDIKVGVQWLFSLKLAKMSRIILILVVGGMWVGGAPKTYTR